MKIKLVPGKDVKKFAAKSKFMKLLSQAQFHGARRMTDRHGWYWMSALILLFAASILVLMENIMRYLDNPTYLVKLSSVQDMTPFPTVVVCPEINFPDHRQDALMEELVFPTGTNKTHIRDTMRQLAAFYSPDVLFEMQELGSLQTLLEYNELDVENTTRRLTTSCEETLLECRFFGRTVACSELFQMELTGDGFCCVFNGQSLRRELQDGVIGSSKNNGSPLLTGEVGPMSGLVALINQTQPHDDISLSYKWASLHHSQKYVDISMNGTALSPGYELWLGYKTFGFQVTDSGLQDLSLHLRRCRMHREEPLQYFPVYERFYCLLECEILHTQNRCGCIRPAHPRPPGLRYCRAQDLACSRHATVSFQNSICDCPMACDMDLPITQVFSYNLIPNSYTYDPIYQTNDFEQKSVLRVFISGYNRKMFAQKPYFNILDLYSQSGGIFSMYFGCSILTLLEIVIILFHYLKGSYKKFNKKKPSKDVEITKFGTNLIKPTLRPTPTISFNKAQSKVLVKKSNWKNKKNKVFQDK